MQFNKSVLTTMITLGVLTLTACGGGGGGDPASPPPVTTPAPEATPSPETSPTPTTTPTPEATPNPEASPTPTPAPSLAPPELSDLAGQTFTLNTDIGTIQFANIGGGEIIECTAVDLPRGLNVTRTSDASTCEINGTPTQSQANTTHTVIATNASGESQASVNIVVNGLAPELIDTDNQTFIRAQRVNIRMDNVGGGELLDCTADLPDGLDVTIALDNSTCEIRGEALALMPPTNFTVEAINIEGTSTANVSIEVVEATPFITRWKTDNPGISASNQITITTAADTVYDFVVDWGDNSPLERADGDVTHTYSEPGEYDVSITGLFPHLFFDFATPDDEEFELSVQSDASKLISVIQWGNRPWQSMEHAFAGSTNLTISDSEQPDLSRVDSTRGMFLNASSFNDDISGWDVSNVKDMAFMFGLASSFNQNINSWNVTNVTDMEGMFAFATSFNQNLDSWIVENVTNMRAMFAFAAVFNQDVNSWIVSNVSNMEGMFAFAFEFNQNLNDWDVSNVEIMSFMFSGAERFNGNIDLWIPANTVDMSSMFEDAKSFNQDIGRWQVSKVTDMEDMFNSAAAFDQNIAQWDVSNVTDMGGMFNNVKLSILNYDALLIGWSARPLQTGVVFDGGLSQFSEDAQAAREILADGFDWSIRDAGLITLVDLVEEPVTLYTNIPSALVLKNTGSSPTSCISEDLPQGLTVDLSEEGTSCKISGTAIDIQAVTSTITATNALGSVETAININVIEETPFITVWKTDNPGSSGDNQITIRTAPNLTYNYSIDWGDGVIEEGVTDTRTHTYESSGEKIISITGIFPQLFFESTTDLTKTDSLKLLSVQQWGQRPWQSMAQSFFNCDNLIIEDIENPDLSQVTSMARMFENADNFNSNIGGWNVSNVTNMSNMFKNARAFNQNIDTWDVSSVTTMKGMFTGAVVFNQDLNSWIVSNVTSMFDTFFRAHSFNGNISDWTVSSVTDMQGMFAQANAFNQNIGGWEVLNVVNMRDMFRNAHTFNQDIGNWNVEKVRNMAGVFRDAKSFNQDVGKWTVTSTTTNMDDMFHGAELFDQDVSRWDISGVGRMNDMFKRSAFSQENYDALLAAWSQRTDLRTGVKLGVGDTTFSEASRAAKDILEGQPFEWIITDGGSDAEASFSDL